MTNNNSFIGGSYIPRNIEENAFETLEDTPVLVIQGARQVGKSTLAARLASKLDSRHVTFDNPTILQAAQNDAISFVKQYSQGVLVIDEAQLFPQILRSIKLAVDENRRPGQFILTGSADLLHITGANESLAGRAETIHLFPFSQGELIGHKEDFVSSIMAEKLSSQDEPHNALDREAYTGILTKGGYPEAITREPRRRIAFFRNYLNSILDHDAVGMSGLMHLDKLSLLFSLISAQTSTELVKANLAKLVGIPESSVHAYITLLHSLCLTNELPAWGRNLSKRAIGRPKLSLGDVGLTCYLNGESAETLSDLYHGESFGALLESLVTSEFFKQQTWSAQDYSLFHFRDKDQREADIVIELRNGKVLAIEVKATRTVIGKHFNNLRYLRDLLQESFVAGIVLYTGEEELSFGDRLFALPVCRLWM